MKQIVIHLALTEETLEIQPAVKHLEFDGTKWILHEPEIHRLFCDFGNVGVTGNRLWSWGVWGPRPYGMKSQFAPYVLEGNRFNLTKFNDHYFPIMRKIIGIARKYGIKTWLVLMDSCQFHGSYRKWSPWYSNVNGVYSFYDRAAQPFLRAWIKKCLAEFKGLSVGWNWGNETNKASFRTIANEVIFDFIRSGDFIPSNCTYGATMSGCDNWVLKDGKWQYICPASTQDLIREDIKEKFGNPVKLAIWREVHKIGEVDPATPPPHHLHQALFQWGNKARIWLSDDGVHANAARWKRVAEVTKPYINDFTYEHMPEATKSEALVTCKTIYKTAFGKDPEQKYHYEPPSPGPEPSPEPPTPGPEPEPGPEPQYSCWHWLWKLDFRRFFKCLFGR